MDERSLPFGMEAWRLSGPQRGRPSGGWVRLNVGVVLRTNRAGIRLERLSLRGEGAGCRPTVRVLLIERTGVESEGMVLAAVPACTHINT